MIYLLAAPFALLCMAIGYQFPELVIALAVSAVFFKLMSL